MKNLNKSDLTKFINDCLNTKDEALTFIFDAPIWNNDGKSYAIVGAWFNDEGELKLEMKFACQPVNSIMQEFDIDWQFPETDCGEPDINQITIKPENGAEYYYNYFNKIWKSYLED